MKLPFNAYISGVGSYLPPNKVTNFDIYKKISNFHIEKAKTSLLKKASMSQTKAMRKSLMNGYNR